MNKASERLMPYDNIIATAEGAPTPSHRKAPSSGAKDTECGYGGTACRLVAVVALSVLLLLVYVVRSPLVYDEPYYIGNVSLLHQYGFSLELLRNFPGPAGPLAQAVQYVFEPWSHLSVPGVRLVNVFLLFLTVAAVYLTLRVQAERAPALSSLAAIALPPTWVMAGLALTEMPALALLSLSVLALLLASRADTRSGGLMLTAMAGILLALAVLGRQPLLLVLPAALIFIARTRDSTLRLCLFLALTLGILGTVFWIWGGIVPPKTAWVGKGISLHNGLLSFSYAAVMILILAPDWFRLGWRITLGIVIAVTTVNAVLGLVRFHPAMSLTRWLLPASAVESFSLLVTGLIVSLGLLFLIATVRNIWENRDDRFYVFVCAAAVLVVASAARITHQYSSRYTATAIPLLLLMAARYSEDNLWKAARLIGGSVAGAFILASYLRILR